MRKIFAINLCCITTSVLAQESRQSLTSQTMKKILMTAAVLLAVVTMACGKKKNVVIRRSQDAITFVVDRDLSAPESLIGTIPGRNKAQQLLDEFGISDKEWIKNVLLQNSCGLLLLLERHPYCHISFASVSPSIIRDKAENGVFSIVG